jgi:hypothetical protein
MSLNASTHEHAPQVTGTRMCLMVLEIATKRVKNRFIVGFFSSSIKDPLLLWFRLSFELHHYCEGMIEMQVIVIF